MLQYFCQKLKTIQGHFTMDIQLYICDGAVSDSADLYIPNFTHHDQNPLLHPAGSQRETILSLQSQGYDLLKTIDITPQLSIEDRKPAERYLLVFGETKFS